MFKRLTRFFAALATASRFKVDNEEDEELTPEERAALGDALREDGSVDIERLKATSRTVDLDTLRREVAGDREKVVTRHHAQS
jgi:hypothetical protein